MSDKGRIGVALVVFVVVMTAPIWYNLADGERAAFPTLSYPHEGGQCVEDTDYMRVNHMRLLMDWRDEAVRANDRIYTASDGRRHEKSLSGTCLSCHWEKEKFCDRCHDYIGVDPYCWNCHVDPM